MSERLYKKAQEDLKEKLGIKTDADLERVMKMSRRERSKLLEAAREVLDATFPKPNKDKKN